MISTKANAANGPVTVDQMVADLTPTYEPLINEWAKTKAGGVRGSVRYHLLALQKLGQVTLGRGQEKPVPVTQPKNAANEEIRAARLNALSAALLENFQVIVIMLARGQCPISANLRT
jgi:hypothetical protein